jgi:ATP-dependent helicase/nuclease subunit B
MAVGSPPLSVSKLPIWDLSISLARGTIAPPPNENLFAHVAGGPNDLLVWLESQLGLHSPSDAAQRLAAINAAAGAAVAQLGTALAISNPYKDHPYAVVGRLLEHRDSFLMASPLSGSAFGGEAAAVQVPCVDTCGFAPAQAASLPQLMQEYAAVMGAATTDQRRAVASAEPDRIARVFDALADGQRLPACRITIADNRAEWPGRWQSLLDKVSTLQKECVVVWATTASPPQANPGSALHTVQTAVDPSFASATVPAITEDDSLRTVRCMSMAVASQAVAAALNGVPAEDLARTVVVCEEDTTAALIDAHLHAFGLPTMGAAIAAQGSEVHALLPLVIEALATPADPRRIKELLSLPESPIPWKARSFLQRAIDDLPAVGSPAWNEALAAISAKYPTEPSLVPTVNQWIPTPASGSAGGSALDPTSVQSAVKALGDWAMNRAHGISDSIKEAYSGGLPDPADTAKLDISEARRSHLQSLHAACRAFESLLATRAAASPISRTEYLQLLDTASQTVPAAPLQSESAGGPRRVRSFAEIDAISASVARVIWVGTNTKPTGRCQWSHHDIDAVRQRYSIDLDSPSHQLGAKRRAERSGLCGISTALLIVNHPSQDSEGRPHPFWVTMSEMLRAGVNPQSEAAYEPAALDPAKPPVSIAPWAIRQTATQLMPPPKPFDQIILPAHVQVQPRAKASQSELLKLLQCPVAWTLTYGCHVRAQTGAGMKNDAILKGLAAEQVMREVFEPSPPADKAAAVAKLTTILRDRLPFIHAGLCQPSATAERLKFEHVLQKAVPVMQCLVDGDVQVTFGAALGQFQTVQGSVPHYNGVVPDGAIDVLGSLAVNGRAVPLVIDEKFGSRDKYLKLLKEARCWQLVMYSDVTGQKAPGIPVDAIGYFVLTEGKLYVPAWAAGELADPRFSSCVEIVGTAGQATLVGQAVALAQQVATASAAAMQPGATMLAHPRLAVAGGTLHPDLAFVGGSNTKEAVKSACEYCDYGALCGKDQVR